MLGMFFMMFIYPVADGLINLILTYLEMKKGKYSLKINEMNLEIQKMVNPEEEKSSMAHQIGFVISNENEEDVDEDL